MMWLRPCKDQVVRWALALILVPLLASCQTVPTKPSTFSAKQIAVLQAYNFVEAEGQWEMGLEGKLVFPVDKSELVAEQFQRLTGMAGRLVEVGITGARVDGHADATGTERYNQILSLRRAQSVRSALLAGGMNEANVKARGLGAAQPIEDNRTARGRRENRRVTIIVSPDGAFAF